MSCSENTAENRSVSCAEAGDATAEASTTAPAAMSARRVNDMPIRFLPDVVVALVARHVAGAFLPAATMTPGGAIINV